MSSIGELPILPPPPQFETYRMSQDGNNTRKKKEEDRYLRPAKGITLKKRFETPQELKAPSPIEVRDGE